MRRLVIAAALALASPAAADSPKLAEAKAALDGVRFPEAQRLLVAALAEGGNSLVATRELYRLSATTAIALNQRDVGEQYFRNWLAIDPAASIGTDVAPKLREPFEAAQAFIAAHGRLAAKAVRLASGEIEVVVTQPLPMAARVEIPQGPSAALSAELRARLPGTETSRGATVVDERGNRLFELDLPGPVIAGEVPVDDAPRPRSTPTPSRTWIKLAIPSAVLLAGGLGFGIAAISEQGLLDEEIGDSGTKYFDEVEARRKRRDIFTSVAAGALTAGVILAVPSVVLFLRSRDRGEAVVPFVDRDKAGVSVVGTF